MPRIFWRKAPFPSDQRKAPATTSTNLTISLVLPAQASLILTLNLEVSLSNFVWQYSFRESQITLRFLSLQWIFSAQESSIVSYWVSLNLGSDVRISKNTLPSQSQRSDSGEGDTGNKLSHEMMACSDLLGHCCCINSNQVVGLIQLNHTRMTNLDTGIDQAYTLFQQTKFHQCIQLLKSLQDQAAAKTDYIGMVDRVIVLRMMAQAYHALTKTTKALGILDRLTTQTLPLLLRNKTQSDQYKYALYLVEAHKVHTTYALILSEQCQSNIDDEEVGYSQKVDTLRICAQKLTLAHDLTKKKFLTWRSKQDKIESEWYEKYAGDLVNIVNTMAIEGQTFEDFKIYERALVVIKKIERFFQVHKTRVRSVGNLFKTYYYKGSILRRLGRFEQAKIYLLKDEKYCGDNNLKQLLKANQIQLRSVYILTGQFQKALKRTQDPQTRSLIMQESSFQKQIKSDIREFHSSPKFSLDTFLSIYSRIMEQQRPFYNELINMSETVLLKHKNTLTKEETFKVSFTIGQAYYLQKKHTQAGQSFARAAGTCTSQEDQLKVRMKRDQIYGNLNPLNIKVIQEMFAKTLQLARDLNSLPEVSLINQNLQVFKQEYLRLSTQQPFQLADDQVYMIKPFLAPKPEVQPEKTKFVNLFSVQPLLQKEDQNIYTKLCFEGKIKINRRVKDQLKKVGSQVLRQFINLESDHLLIILQSIHNIVSIDLQLHLPDQHFWKQLVTCISNDKIFLQGLQQLVVCSAVDDVSLLYRVLEQTQKLRVLKVQNSYLSQIHGLSWRTLQVLSLSHTFVADHNLNRVRFEEMPNLKELSLVDNRLTGLCFGNINGVTHRLKKLNLSGNQLGENCKYKLTIHADKVVFKKLSFNKDLASNISDIVYSCHVLSVSESVGVSQVLRVVNDRYEQSREQLCLRQFKACRIILDSECCKQMTSFLIITGRTLSLLRLKFIKEEYSALSQIVRLVDQKFTYNLTLDVRGSEFAPTVIDRVNLLS